MCCSRSVQRECRFVLLADTSELCSVVEARHQKCSLEIRNSLTLQYHTMAFRRIFFANGGGHRFAEIHMCDKCKSTRQWGCAYSAIAKGLADQWPFRVRHHLWRISAPEFVVDTVAKLRSSTNLFQSSAASLARRNWRACARFDHYRLHLLFVARREA